MDRFEPLFISFPLANSSQALIRDSFDVTLSHSDGILVGSKKAAYNYHRIFQIPCREILAVFRGALAPAVVSRGVWLSKLRQLENSTKRALEIVLAGQIYARDTTGLFLDALARFNDISNGDGYNYSLSYYGEYPIRSMYSHTCINAHGMFKYDELK